MNKPEIAFGTEYDEHTQDHNGKQVVYIDGQIAGTLHRGYDDWGYVEWRVVDGHPWIRHYTGSTLQALQRNIFNGIANAKIFALKEESNEYFFR